MKPDVAARTSILAKCLRIPSFRECGPLLREAREQGLDYEAFLLLLLLKFDSCGPEMMPRRAKNRMVAGF